MTQPPLEPEVPKPRKNEIATRIAINRRLEAADELFDRVLNRMEDIERSRRLRRRIFFTVLWLAAITAAVVAVAYSAKIKEAISL